MKVHKEISQAFPDLTQSHIEGYLQRTQEVSLEIEQELAVLKEWGDVITKFLDYIFVSSSSTHSWRQKIEDGIYQCTHGRICVWWEPLPKKCIAGNGHLIEIRYHRVRYGVLKLTSGYLVSHLAPNIHQMFGHLCGLIITLAEHQVLVESLLRPLQSSSGYEVLTPRETEVLKCMALGENENSIAEHLGIALTTVRTHRHKIYSCLQVHNPQDAVLKSFALRLFDWLDLAESNLFS
jgi:DNA-binding CsgD family transcriptional regulator